MYWCGVRAWTTCVKDSGTLEDRRDTHAASGADGDQAAARTLLLEHLRQRGDDARTGRREGMTRRETGAVDVELRRIDRSQRAIEAQPVAAIVFGFPCTQRAEHLRGKRLVDFVEVEILQGQAGLLEH